MNNTFSRFNFGLMKVDDLFLLAVQMPIYRISETKDRVTNFRVKWVFLKISEKILLELCLPVLSPYQYPCEF